MTPRPSLLAVVTVGVALAFPMTAKAQLDYRGLAYARTSGNSCREASPTANALAYTKTGVKNNSGATVTVWCPIVRRNSTPVGRVERRDSSRASSFIPTAKIDELSVDVRFAPQLTGTACTAYGRLPGSMGGVFFSSTRWTCGKNLADCAGGEKTQTLTWRDPFKGAPRLVNIGLRCDLRHKAGIVGSVASFSGDFVPVAGSTSPAGAATTAATPRRWVLQDAGSNCRRSSQPGSLQYFADSVVNDQAANVTVLCPVALGGQFDAFDAAAPDTQVVFHHATVPVARATITVGSSDPKRSISCTAVAATGNGNSWLSRTVSVAGTTGLTQKINLAALGNWGGTLGTGRRQVPIRSLSYLCTLPPGTRLQRYVTAVCQNNADCQDGDRDGHGQGNDDVVGVAPHSQPRLFGRVQHNGTECLPHDSHNSTAAASFTYSEDGIRLSPSAAATELAQVACPLAAATGDSQMAPGRLERVEVFMTGRSATSTTMATATAPPCRVLTLDTRNTEADFIGAEEFKRDPSKSMWSWSGRRAVDRLSAEEGSPSLYLSCFLSPGEGIAGVVTTQDLGTRAAGAVRPRPPVQPPTIGQAAW